jgi:hypothetical protein
MNNKSNLFILVVTAALTLLAGPARADVWYVDGTTSGDGTIWAEGFETIAEAITIASAGDEIWVKMGTYAISSQIQVNKAVGIYGGFAGDESERSQRDWAGNVTTIDGQDTTAILKITDEPTIDGFTLTNGYNTDDLRGGAIHIVGLNKTPMVSNCIISGNTAYADPMGPEGYDGGGAIYVGIGNPIFTNCLITNNSTNGYGGAVNTYSGSADFINCTISENIALEGGGVYILGDATNIHHEFYNCIVWGNTATSAYDDLRVKDAGDEPEGSNNCCSVDLGTGTIYSNPLFVDPDNGDFHLQAVSPCIDTGTDTVALPDTDIQNGDRVIDGDNDASAIVDIGAYEAPCRIDVPDVVGMTESEAQNSLNDVGLVKGPVTFAYSNTVDEGFVAGTAPPVGTFVPCGATVGIIISDGPPIVPNDLCDSPDTVLIGIDYPGTTIDASGAIDSSCADNDTLDVWYKYEPATSGLVCITLSDSDFDTTLAVYDTCGGTELACNDDFGEIDIDSQVTVELTAGVEYLIRVAGYDGQSGDFTLHMYSPETFDNDICAGAIPVEANEVYFGSTIGATGTSESGCSYNDSVDVWYSFRPESNVSAEISLCGSTFDTTLTVYDGCKGSRLACNDDYCDLQSQVALDLPARHTYLIRIAGYDEETGDYTLFVKTTPISSAADLNMDGKVNLEDLAILYVYWQMSEPSVDIAPVVGDGIINVLDATELANRWLE